MNQIAAFHDTVVLADRKGMPETSDIDPALGLAHLRHMYFRIQNGEFSSSKIGRWLGWAQAALVAANVGVTLEDVKQINLKHNGDTPPANQKIDAVLLGGVHHGLKTTLKATPPQISVLGKLYTRIDDPGTGEYLGAYAFDWKQ